MWPKSPHAICRHSLTTLVLTLRRPCVMVVPVQPSFPGCNMQDQGTRQRPESRYWPAIDHVMPPVL